MNKNTELLGYCGLYCGSCDHYRASFPDGKHLLDEINKNESKDKFKCKGCRGEITSMHDGCVKCKIKICADEKNIMHCGLCDIFPCNIILDFQNDKNHIHHSEIIRNLKELKMNNIQEWLLIQERSWQCQCGKYYSWYEEECQRCRCELVSYKNYLIKKD